MAVSPNGSDQSAWTTALPGVDTSAMEVATQGCKAWFKYMMAMNSEVNRFFTQRLQQDAQLPLRIVQCRNPQEVLQTQIDFFKKMADDYSGEAEKLGTLLTESFHEMDRPSTLAWPETEEERRKVGPDTHSKAA